MQLAALSPSSVSFLLTVGVTYGIDLHSSGGVTVAALMAPAQVRARSSCRE